MKKEIKLVGVSNRSLAPVGPTRFQSVREVKSQSAPGAFCVRDPEFNFQVLPQILEEDRRVVGDSKMNAPLVSRLLYFELPT